MIEKAEEKDLKNLQNLYKSLYSEAYQRYWFEKEYDPFETYVVNKEDSLKATIVSKQHTMNLNDKKIGARFLSHFYMSIDMKDEGYQQQMLSEVLEEISYTNLIVLAKPSKKELLEDFDFKPLYTRRNYVLSRAQIPVYPKTGIVEQFDEMELAKLYQQYSRLFNGYFTRDTAYYSRKREYWKNMNYKVIVYYDSAMHCTGYMVFDPTEYPIKTKEVVYLNSVALLKMLSYALNFKDAVQFSLTAAENISKLVPTAIYSTDESIMGKITDLSLFNRLFNTNVQNIAEFASLSKKPFYLNEEE